MFDPNKSSPKVDHDEKCSGKAIYVADIEMDGMLFAKTVRSKIAHGHIKSIEIPSIEEGYFIVDHHDVIMENYVSMIFKDWPVFA
ncbi:MAG TPA: aldehyde oxidase, partial [Firmicutes bacterium]|nr:aldehyde oxidase [Bacillota bacterium]